MTAMFTRDLLGDPVVSPATLDRAMVERGIANRLSRATAADLVGMMYSDVMAVIDFAELCNGGRTGQKISLLFNPHRLDTATVASKSIVEALQDDRFSSGLARALIFKSGKVSELLYQTLQLGVNSVQYVNEFPPHIARDIYCEYRARRILDPCAGWGGRMIGAASIGAFYHGFEPSARTFDGLCRLGEFLKSFETGFEFQIEKLPFEDADLEGSRYDIAFTSPPYFDTERYSSEPTQAAIRWPTFGQFVDGFYLPMVEKASNAADGGLLINIGSRRYPMRKALVSAVGERVSEVSWLRLSGSSGLGKHGNDGEVFLHVAPKETGGSVEPAGTAP